VLGFYSVDITIDDDGKPNLIEINGSNSGFDGFLIAYEDMSLQAAISAAFRELAGDREVYVVTQLGNFGQLPPAFLDKLLQDLLYFKSIESVHATFRKGMIGSNWARMRTDRPPSTIGAGTSLDALVQIDPRFKKVMLNVSDPSYVIPLEYFKDDVDRGALSFKSSVSGSVEAHRLRSDDALWLRCQNLAFAEPLTAGQAINAEFPYESIADNKWFAYEALVDHFPSNHPPSVPVGNRCSGSWVVRDLLARSQAPLFIRKPLLGSQARGIEVIRRQDVEDYAERLQRLEQARPGDGSLPLELQGVPELLATWALRFDVSLLSELRLSRPVYCRRTGRLHHGCIRTILLLRERDDKSIDVRFLGAYWRLARVPIDGDGLLWERFIGSQSQGAFCEPVPPDDLAIAERFAKNVVADFCRSVSALPADRDGYRQWETEYWLARYRRQAPVLQDEKTWQIFMSEISAAEEEGTRARRDAEAAGFLRDPSTVLSRAQSISARFPYLVKEPQRIVVR
jgi:hypothetical protein